MKSRTAGSSVTSVHFMSPDDINFPFPSSERKDLRILLFFFLLFITSKYITIVWLSESVSDSIQYVIEYAVCVHCDVQAEAEEINEHGSNNRR